MFFKKCRQYRPMLIGALFLSVVFLGIIPIETMPSLFAGFSQMIFRKVSLIFVFVGLALYSIAYILIWVYFMKEALQLPFVRRGIVFLIKRIHLGRFYPFKIFWRKNLYIRKRGLSPVYQGSIFAFLIIAAFMPGLLKVGTIWCGLNRSRLAVSVLLFSAIIKVTFLTFITGNLLSFLGKLF